VGDPNDTATKQESIKETNGAHYDNGTVGLITEVTTLISKDGYEPPNTPIIRVTASDVPYALQLHHVRPLPSVPTESLMQPVRYHMISRTQ